MIYDKISNLKNYLGLSENIDKVISFILKVDIKRLAQGKTVIDNDNVYVNHFSYMTKDKSENELFENHDEYIDLHLVLSGNEYIGVSYIDKLKMDIVIKEEDSTMYIGNADIMVPMYDDMFLLVYPGEAHLPKLKYVECVDVDKLVFKIRI